MRLQELHGLLRGLEQARRFGLEGQRHRAAGGCVNLVRVKNVAIRAGADAALPLKSNGLARLVAQRAKVRTLGSRPSELVLVSDLDWLLLRVAVFGVR